MAFVDAIFVAHQACLVAFRMFGCMFGLRGGRWLMGGRGNTDAKANAKANAKAKVKANANANANAKPVAKPTSQHASDPNHIMSRHHQGIPLSRWNSIRKILLNPNF